MTNLWFSLPLSQSIPTPLSVNQITRSVSVIGLPGEGENMISELMTLYDSNMQPSKNSNQRNLNSVKNHVQELQKFQFQIDESFYSQGIFTRGNISGQPNLSLHQQSNITWIHG